MDRTETLTKWNYKDKIKESFIEKEGKANFKKGKKEGIPYTMACCMARAILSEKEALTGGELIDKIESFSNAIELHQFLAAHGADNYYWKELTKKYRQANFEVARVETVVLLKPTDEVLEDNKELEETTN